VNPSPAGRGSAALSRGSSFPSGRKGHHCGFFVPAHSGFRVKQRDHSINRTKYFYTSRKRSCERPEINQCSVFMRSEYCRPHLTMAKFGAFRKSGSARISSIAEIIKSRSSLFVGIRSKHRIHDAARLSSSSCQRPRHRCGQPQRRQRTAHPVGVPLHEVFVPPYQQCTPCRSAHSVGGRVAVRVFTFTGFSARIYCAPDAEKSRTSTACQGAHDPKVRRAPSRQFCKGFCAAGFQAFAIVCSACAAICFLL